jgi:[acyl-carrier-protein] S-malonyltransferase
LCRQITETVDWSRCLQTLYERGCRVFLELGPGAALSRMIHQRFPDAQARSLDDFRSLAAATQWVEARMQ